jgi:hypothetical protein
MRKGVLVVIIIALLNSPAPSLWALGIINKQNLSAEYFRTLNRNAATDMADAVLAPRRIMRANRGFMPRATCENPIMPFSRA